MYDSDYIFLFSIFLFNGYTLSFLGFLFQYFSATPDWRMYLKYNNHAFSSLLFGMLVALIFFVMYVEIYSSNPNAYGFVEHQIKWQLILSLLVWFLNAQFLFLAIFGFFWAFGEGDWKLVGLFLIFSVLLWVPFSYFASTYPTSF